MAETNKLPEKKKVPPVANFDKGVRDFFRGSRGFSKNFGGGQGKRDFTGMRRGSR
jgi:hypothetical protein